jgi:putative acetyltransferase
MFIKEFRIRPATNADIPSIQEVVFLSLYEFSLRPELTGKDKDLIDIEKSYLSNDGFFGVAVDVKTNRIVGTFGLFRIDEDVCELRKMYLLKEVRGKGLGNFVLQTAIGIAKEKHFKKIILETISPLTAAISLYKKFGFKETMPEKINARVDQAYELDIQ